METRNTPLNNSTSDHANPLSHVTHPVAFLLTGIVWTLLVLFSLWTQREQLNRTAQELARIDAIANLKKDMAIRKWASVVGGVYIKEDLAPNVDALSEQERVQVIRLTGEMQINCSRNRVGAGRALGNHAGSSTVGSL